MNLKRSLFLLLSFYFALASVKAQDPVMDSLKLALKSAKQDTARCSILNAIIEAEGDDNIWSKYNDQLKDLCEINLKKYKKGDKLFPFYLKQMAAALNNEGYLANLQGNIPKALSDFEHAMAMEEQAGNKKGVATSLNNIGSVYQYQGNIAKALECYNKGFAIYSQVKDQRGMAESLRSLGLVFSEKGDTPKALEYYQKSLTIQEKINDKDGISMSLNNIGAIYQDQGDLDKALEYYQRCLKIQEELNRKEVMAGSLHNIGSVYKDRGDFTSALLYVNKSYKLVEETGNIAGMAHCLNTTGSIYNLQGDSKKALEYWRKSFALWEQINGKQGMALTGNHIAMKLFEQGNYGEAEKFAIRSLKLSRELGFPENIKGSSKTLSEIYGKKGNWKAAYEMQVLHKQMSDSSTSAASRKAIVKRTFKYEYEKKAAADSVKALAELKVFDAERRQQRIQRTALSFGIGFIALFALFMYSRFRVTQKQKQIIELKEKETQLQKNIIEEKHKEINDSINYAERIQRSFLATKEILDKNLGDYFVLFKPKDIVSGDFYWASKLQNGDFAFVVADSTGHGVPGAIMSLLNITSLEKAVEKSSDPAEILNQTRKTIIERLKKDGSPDGGKDGMDCSLMAFDFKKRELKLAAAQNPVWIIRKNNADANELIELSPDKMPVGKHEKDQHSFTQQNFQLISGDMVYAITDGFADQFGGPKGKKFMHKRLKDLLLSIAVENTVTQKEILLTTLRDWEGDLEQVDDITLAGIRIS